MHTLEDKRANLDPNYSSKNRIFLSILGVRFSQMWRKMSGLGLRSTNYPLILYNY